MLKSKLSDILMVGLISGVVALLTSIMGITGTIIGSVVTSLVAEFLKTFFKDPIKDKIETSSTNSRNYNNRQNYSTDNYYNDYEDYYEPSNYNYSKTEETYHSLLNTKVLFLFPLVVILIIELIHFLSMVGLISYDIFLNLESLTNWQLFRTIGYALVIMGFYPIVSGKLSSKHGVILIIVGIIQLIIGYADTVSQMYRLVALFGQLRNYISIAVIIAILYTILTIPDEIKEHENKVKRSSYQTPSNYNRRADYNQFKSNERKFKSRPRKSKKNYKKKNYNDNDNEDDYYYYY